MINDYYLIRNIPSIDLHGLPRDIARSNLMEFIDDNLKLGNKYIEIIHGIGEGVLKEEVHDELKHNKNIIDFKTKNNNSGATIALLRE